ncbi:N-formylglutamate amidohydrolase [Commensalibacter oyaizuii]|uniref:N-formylglutamate amidohydrolase n=1 Tax=Commensalibacter oyaizuii TaxID=3043873 RepID=A0ABT6PZR5_9PROT|nr:N-formylglutamate amidohydrolase [Commensalibacter sp. TBRC 16381]MDI2090205.1 N-formylglutamate amidohydrolase [Commensalibacter sp. TBRC 16381]
MLLCDTDPNPVTLVNPDSLSPFFLVCDHAGFTFPKALKNLGLTKEDQQRHISGDIGIKGVGEKLSSLLHATLITQSYSRLVIDCNRNTLNPTLIAPTSDDTVIPGNQNLSLEQQQARITEIYQPYHQKISDLLDCRLQRNIHTVFVSLHSFTPKMQNGEKRPWHAGILHEYSDKFSLLFKQKLQENYAYPIGDNQPYALTEKNDYTVPNHALKRNIPYLELEIRQDLITTSEQQEEWAERLSFLLPIALKDYTIL